MTITVQVEGLRDLERALEDLTKAAGKGVLRRALKKAAEPVAEKARNLAPDDPATSDGDLKSTIAVSSVLSPRQRRQHNRMFRDQRASVEMFVGAGPVPQAHLQEFGTSLHGPQPFMRPAWQAEQGQMLSRLSNDLWAEVQKSIARAERKAARAQVAR